MSILILLILLAYKFTKITLIYNALIIPLAIYLFLSRKSIYKDKNLSFILLIIFQIINLISFFINAPEDWDFGFLFIRSISLTFFNLSIFGLLPYNDKLYKVFIIPIVIYIPALFFIKDPPLFYSYASEGEFVGSIGLLSGTSLAGLFPTSFYFAQLLTAYILYLNYLIKDKFYYSLTFFKRINLDRFISFILLTFTNRKAFLLPFLFSLFAEISSSSIFILKNNKIKKTRFWIILLSIILVILIYSVIANSFVNFSFINVLKEIIDRVIFYSNWAINPDNFQFFETSIMVINSAAGKVPYYFTFFLLFLSLIINGRDLNKKGLLRYLVVYFYVFLFLFKEAATIFSPSPSSLILMMTISAIINSYKKNNSLI